MFNGMISDILFRLRALFRRNKTESDLSTELNTHLEHAIEKNIKAGMTADEARRRAVIDFGGLEQIREECRDARGVSFAETLFQDMRYGLRMMRKNPVFTAIAVLTLALGIGASTAVFSVVNTVLLKPMPYKDPDRIMTLSRRAAPSSPYYEIGDFPWNQREFRTFRDMSTTFQYLAAFKGDTFNLLDSGEPELLEGIRATGDFFQTLGIPAIEGRTFTSEDLRENDKVVVISHQLWHDRFGLDPHIVGRTVSLNGFAYTVIGVMPGDFGFPHAEEMPPVFNLPHRVQLWLPFIDTPNAPGASEYAAIGLLKTGVTTSQMHQELSAFQKRVEEQNSMLKDWSVPTKPLLQQAVGDTRRPLLLILLAVGVVLLVACSNVASLLLTRSLERGRELALRTALGASRNRLIGQLLTESLLLAIAGGILGVIFSKGSIYFVKVFGPPDIPRLQEVALDVRVLSFAIGITFITGIVFGLVPAIWATKRELVGSIKEGGPRSGGSPTSTRIRNVLLISQMALAVVLVVASGLLIQTFYRMLKADTGFNSTHVLTFELALPSSKYSDTDKMTQVYTGVLKKLQNLPGAASVGFNSVVPFNGAPDNSVIRIPGHPPVNSQQPPYANYSFASAGYFSAVGTPILQGRDFSEADTLESTHVTIINRAMAKKFWPGEDPIGKQVGVNTTKWPVRTIVGVVGDIKHSSMREDPTPEMYVPYTQNEIKIWPSMGSLQVAVRTKADPISITGALRDAVHSVDPDLPVAKVALLTELVNTSMTQARFSMLLLICFGGLSLLLALIGLYGVISYSVQQRTRQIGIRIALGASRNDVLMMILGQGMRLAGIGIILGIAVALAVTKTMTAFLYGVQATDPLTFVVVALTLMVAALSACYLPARRAMRVDPIVALRYE